MQKGKIIVILISCAVFAAAVFVWAKFSGKKTMNIVAQNPIAEIVNEENSDTQNIEQETINSEQDTVNNEQEMVDSEQGTVNNEQQAVTNNQQSVASDQEKEKTETENTTKIIEKFVSWGFEKSSGRKIDTIIIHSSYDALGSEPFSVSGLINEYKQYGVAAHYLIDREGKIYQLVADKNVAYHAGESKMPDGRSGVNSFSIGVEMMNKENGKFTDEQYDALNYLIKNLKQKYSIKYVLGHDDIAPDRKTDPWGIDWNKVDK